MEGEIELYNISFLILKVELHFNYRNENVLVGLSALFALSKAKQTITIFIYCAHDVSKYVQFRERLELSFKLF